MKSDKPFLKSFACGGVLFLAFAAWLIATGEEYISYRLGQIITGTWGRFSKEKWPWGRFIVTFGIMYIVTDILVRAGRAPG
ncbi:MAG TPA: hypothetical protein VG796_21515 [Verrucomicrobiales bacterium]|jgi:hypothetical protein|nr:hypothetical protein [Verrucomicrobiales bacterium]